MADTASELGQPNRPVSSANSSSASHCGCAPQGDSRCLAAPLRQLKLPTSPNMGFGYCWAMRSCWCPLSSFRGFAKARLSKFRKWSGPRPITCIGLRWMWICPSNPYETQRRFRWFRVCGCDIENSIAIHANQQSGEATFYLYSRRAIDRFTDNARLCSTDATST